MRDGSLLILGAAGFIGRTLAEAFAALDRDVIAATRRPTSFSRPSIVNVVAPYDSPDQFAPLLARSRAVIHAASISTPGSSEAQPQLDGNLRTMLALVEALQAAPDRRLVYLSSGGTLYGDRQRAAREDDPLRPRSYHGAGKAAAEHFVHAWAMQYSGTAVVLRPSNVYGPGQLPRKGFGIIPTAFDCALRGQPITIWGDGSSVRDYLYVDDLVALCRLAVEQNLPQGVHTYNASYGQGISLVALLDAIDATIGRPLHRIHEPARRVDVRRIVPANAAAGRLGWHPATNLDQGLRETWQWFITRP
jgi:UDP-glucose 4-epimerase